MMGPLRLQMFINDISNWYTTINDARISLEVILIDCKTPAISIVRWQPSSQKVNLHSPCQNSNTRFHCNVSESKSHFWIALDRDFVTIMLY
jgi:hypothetical protein